MILPTKGISQERCLLTIGAEVLALLERPDTPSGVWEGIKLRHAGSRERVSFDWFTLALAFLYAGNLVTVDQYGFLRRVDASAQSRVE
jgi:hypothetical protein